MNVWAIAREHRGLLIAGTVVGAVGSAVALGQPLAIGGLVRAVERGDSLLWPVALGVVLFCLDAALAALHAYLIGRAGENIVFGLRHRLTGRLLGADMTAFNRLDQGDVFTRMVSDTSVARVTVSDSLAQIVTSGFMVAGGIALMAWIDVWLLLVTLGCLGVASAVSLVLATRVRRASVRNREDTAMFGSGLQRVLGAMATVKASRAEQRETDRIGVLAQQARRSGVRVSALSALMTPAMNVGTQISLGAVIGWGMSRVAAGTMDVADLTAFVMYLFYLVAPLVLLFMSLARFQQGRASIARVAELGSTEQEEPRPGPPVPVRPGPAVEFDRVTFTYGGTEPALDDVSFSVPDRGLTAIVGPSGAGKTTIFQLIERFYRPTSGTVRVAGADIAAMPLDQLRLLVGYVDQESTLMRGTVRDNLTYANPGASDDDIERALSQADLDEVVSCLPDGLSTNLGERGMGLSGGQKQRLAVARTLLQRPRVVLFDEATAHLDSDAEVTLTQTMATIARHCAVVVIGHRISTVAGADQIILLEGGKVRATGTHTSLKADDPLYRRLSAQQQLTEAIAVPGGAA